MIKEKFIPWTKENYALFIGLFIVVILSSITYHTDLNNLSQISNQITSGNFNIYNGFTAGGVQFGAPIMPPFILIFDAFLYLIFKILRILNFNYSLAQPTTWQLLALKSRYVLIFILSYPLVKVMALQYTKDKITSQKIANLWITSPILLYLTFAQGNNDIYPALFSIIFLYFIFRGKNIWAMIFLGLTAALKNYAIFLFLPTAIILSEKDIRKTMGFLAIAGSAFLLPAIFFLKGISNFSVGGGEGFLILNTHIPSTVNFAVFPILYSLIILYLYFSDNVKEIKGNKPMVIVLYAFLVMSLFYVFSYYIPQWFLWILPFFILLIYESKKLFYLYILLSMTFFISILVNWQNNIDLKLFQPILPISVGASPIYPNFLNTPVPTLVYAFFTSLFVLFLYFLFKEYKKPKEAIDRSHILYNLSPLFVFFLLLFFSYFVNNIRQDKDKNTNMKIISKLSDNKGTTIYDSSDKSKKPEFTNINSDGDLLMSVDNPQIIIPSPIKEINVTESSELYAVLKFRESGIYIPNIFLKTSLDKPNAESKSISNFRTYDGKIYYAKIGHYAMDNVEGIRIVLSTRTPFHLDDFRIIDLSGN